MTAPLPLPACIAFAGHDLIAEGSLPEVLRQAKTRLDQGENASILLFDSDGRLVEADFRGTVEEVLARLPQPVVEAAPKAGPGRPKLGVVAREVTLLPRHWDWLAKQPGGASVALRKLIEDARRQSEPEDRLRERREAVHRFLTALAGDLPNYEEVLRALYAWDRERLSAAMAGWPEGVRQHVERMVAAI